MFFDAKSLAANSRLRAHWNDLWANRNIYNAQNQAMIEANRALMSPEMLAANAVAGLGRDFWAQVDGQILEMRNQETGMEIVNDLLAVQTVLPIGKTAKLYNVTGDIADDVSVSLDGQPPYSFDHTEYDSDGDPIPVFTAGYGVNWRHAAGLSTVGIDLVLDSQRAKLRKFNKQLVSYVLDGDARIKVASYPGQGLRNHRNTTKIDLTTASVDLTSANAAGLLAFFGQAGAFGQGARANRVDAYDVLWVSYEIWANLAQPYLIEVNAGTNGLIGGSVLQAILPFTPIKEIRPTYALTGNEFVGYQRRRDVVSPLVGMATGVVPLPRPLPQTNYNFQIMAAMGLQISKDAEGHSGTIYGANLT